MMQGDQFRLPIELKDADGTFVTQEEVKDIEVFVGKTRKSLSAGNVSFESKDNIFYVFLTQRETFLMSGDTAVQARILFLSGDVIGVDLGKINFAEAISKVVLK